ncbi:MAG TPA: hypothetical protein VIV06_12175 [Candidatus Limnocylindrales bacterium]
MTPPFVVGAGFGALVLGGLLLATFGTRFRVGRLLASAPRVSIDEAIAIARRGEPRYVAVAGRIDADDEFEDEHHRPLVFRRQRLLAHRAGRWQTVDDRSTAVEFGVREGLSAIAVDQTALGPGLVVVAREATGSAVEVRELIGGSLPDTTRVRLRIEQVSSVEHALVAGRPRLDPSGHPQLTAGLGRPLILTTLEGPEAMRILAGGARLRPLAATLLLVAGLGLLAVGVAWSFADAIA